MSSELESAREIATFIATLASNPQDVSNFAADRLGHISKSNLSENAKRLLDRVDTDLILAAAHLSQVKGQNVVPVVTVRHITNVTTMRKQSN